MQKTPSSEHNDDKAEHVGQGINFRWRDVNQGLVHPDRKSKRDKKKRLHPSPVWCIHEFNCCYLQEHGPGITKEHRQLTSSYTTKEEASFFSTVNCLLSSGGAVSHVRHLVSPCVYQAMRSLSSSFQRAFPSTGECQRAQLWDSLVQVITAAPILRPHGYITPRGQRF